MLFRDTIFTKHRRVVLCVRNAVETCKTEVDLVTENICVLRDNN
jgi:hypothetical protein